ncbi:MAG TPA: hypothetical protein VK157_10185, partial [Phycisphaerales bacterium]|nr:hypothetical protein [Phycisphaerales bacterium]
MGLDPFSVIVWGSGELTELRADRADAIREWVNRGGHLVIILPAVSQLWTGGKDTNPLHDIMPYVVFNRRENVSLLRYRPLLSGKTDTPFPQRGVLHTFTINPRALPSEATPILNGPDGECVVVRRLVGAGAVTLVGFDFNDTRFSQFENVEADIFWHRVLGRSGNLKPLFADPTRVDTATRPRWMIDNEIPRLINITGVSAIGALVGFLVFALYWLVVGPPLFFLLKRKDQHRHSWVAFVIGGVFFTVLAWGLATFLRPLRTTATHFTVLDHVYGQPVQRARSWASVLVPRYGSATISVGNPTGIDDRSPSAIAAFESPSEDAATAASFPDSRGYPIDTRSPDAIRVPVRATVKQVQMDWSGSPTWDMIRPVQPAGAPPLPEGEQPVIRAFPPNAEIPPGAPLVIGTVRHNLPGPITDGFVILVRGQTPVKGNLGATVQGVEAVGRAMVLPTFDPGVDLDLSTIFATGSGAGDLQQWLSSQTAAAGNSAFGVVSNTVDAGTLENRLYASAFLHASRQPDFSSGTASTAATTRQLLHGFDLSRWMTQPCIIIIGLVGKQGGDGIESPVPLFVDGEPVPSKGLTFVRWVYPLSPAPPPVGPPEEQTGRQPRPTSKPTEPAEGN